MPDSAPREPPAPFPSEAEIDAVLAEFGHDPRAAIRALLRDLDMLARDAEASTSRGYVRGRIGVRQTSRPFRAARSDG
jgi:hypothetical protein